MSSKRKKKNNEKIDYEGFKYGPIKFERFGRVIQISSDWDPEEFKEHKANILKNRPELKREINKKIKELISLVKQFEPLDFLTSVSLQNTFSDPETYREMTHEGNETYVEYAQSIILGEKRKSNVKAASNNAIEKFNKLIPEIHEAVLWYFGTEVVEDKRSHVEEEMRFMAIATYLSVRGDSYPEHHIEMIREIFKDHDKFLKEHIGYNSTQIIKAVDSIEQQIKENLLSEVEILRSIKELHKIYLDFIDKKGMDSFDSVEDCKKEFFAQSDVKEKKEELDTLYSNAKKNIFEITQADDVPLKLLKLLSAQLGDNFSFLQFKKSPAWPTNDSIIYSKPIIEDKGIFYCFAPQVLSRNLGTIIEGLIEEADKEYYLTKYQEKRSRFLERKGFEYLQKILPTAEVFQNLYYTINQDGKSKRVETDGLVIYDEYLFIVEAKSGSLSASAKRGGLERMKKDASDLINSAYEQAMRTKEFIMAESKPAFEYEDGSVAVVIKDNSKFKNIFLLNITLQNLGQLSTHLNSLKNIGVIRGKEWPWSVYINDLRVISELMEFPSEFIHFLKGRIKVNDYPQFRTIDELDFLMYYLNHGLYVKEEEIKNVTAFIPTGYTEDLDRYYDYVAGRVSSGEKPKLKVSDDLKKFINKIESTQMVGFTRVATTLLNFNSESQKDIIDNLNKRKEKSQKDWRDHDFSMLALEANVGITFSTTKIRDQVYWANLNEYCELKMYQMKWDEWFAISISSGKDTKEELDFRIYEKEWNHDIEMEKKLEKFKQQKISKIRNSGQKIGRNDPCPCGSGLKFKKCCGK